MMWRGLVVGLAWVAALGAQYSSGSGSSGGYAGPNVLSRWSRLQNGTPSGPTLRGYLHASYSYFDGLIGPVANIPASRPLADSALGANSLTGGGGLTLNRPGARSSLMLSYGANYSATYSKSANAYRGLNQDVNLTYERQLTRRWGFFTGHNAGSQASILGLERSASQRNYFEPAFTPNSEALDARMRSISSGAGFFFNSGSRWSGSFDGGMFAVSRQSQSLVSSRGERAQGETAYRFSRNQSVGAIYSFSHFYFPRGFGETYVHSIMLSYTRRLSRYWNMQVAAGPYQADSQRLREVPVDPFIAALTGNSSTIEVFNGRSTGIGANAAIGATLKHDNFHFSYRRSVDAGNGLTLSSLTQGGQALWGHQSNRNLGLSASLFFTRMDPVLTGLTRNARYQSYGGNYNMSYRLTETLHLVGNVGLHNITYESLRINQLRRVAMVGVAYSPGALPLMR